MERKIEVPSKAFAPEFSFETQSKDVANRVMTISFASETPYLRDFGYEIIDIATMKMDRLNASAPLLYNHDDDQYIGVVEKAWTDSITRKAYAQVRFSKNPLAQQILNDIDDGIIKNVSFKYLPFAARELQPINGLPAFAFSVEGSEVSFVTRPADTTVGLGRSLEEKETKVSFELQERKIEENQEEKTQEELEKAQKEKEEIEKANNEEKENKEILLEQEKSLAKEIEKLNNENININTDKKMDKELIKKMRELAKSFGQESLALEFIEAEKSFEEFQTELLVRSKTNHSAPNVHIKNTNDEKSPYVLGQAIKELANGAVSDKMRELEKGVCAKFGVEKKANSASLMLPLDELSRNVTVANPASAGALVTEELDGSYLSSLSQNLVVGQLGARIVPVSGVGSYRVPVFGQVFDATDAYKPELALGEEFSLDVSDVVLEPKTLQIYARVTREIMQQSPYNIQTIVANEMNKAILRAMNSNVFNGPATAGKITGVLNTTGVENINVDTLNYVAVMQLLGIIEDNLGFINEGSTKFVTNNAGMIQLATTQKANALDFIYDPFDKKVGGYELLRTGLIKAKTVGSDSYNPLILGDWSNLIIGMWGGIEISVNPYFYQNGDLSITATLTYDSKVVRPEAFVIANLKK